MMRRIWIAGLLAALITGCNLNATREATPPAEQVEQVTPAPGTLDLAATVLAHDDLSTLGSALVAAGVAPELEGETAYTLLAPTDAAFEALPEGALEALFDDPAALAELVRYHLITGVSDAAGLGQLGTAVTIQGEPLTVTLTSDVELQINDAVNVVEPDIVAANGILHKIDQVLLPSTVAAAMTQPAAEAEAGTIPPTAPEAVTETVALPTITPQGGATVTETAPITDAAGMTATAGITPTDSVTEPAPVTTTNAQDQTITDYLAARPDLSSTSTAIATAGLAEALTEPGPFTFFAPSNAAYERVPAAEMDALLNDNVRLARTMQYHVVADRVTVADLARLGMALSTMGQAITISADDSGTVLANGAPVLESIETANGIIHVVDGILIPADE